MSEPALLPVIILKGDGVRRALFGLYAPDEAARVVEALRSHGIHALIGTPGEVFQEAGEA